MLCRCAAYREYGSDVTTGVAAPLIFVDIVGVLIPLRAMSNGRRRSNGNIAEAADDLGNPQLERLDLEDGRRLLALPGELVWAATWRGEANEVVAPRVGLPALPLVGWPDDDAATHLGVHWKTAPPGAVGRRTAICLARRRNHRRRPALGRRAPSAAGAVARDRSIPGTDRCRPCRRAPVARTPR